MKITTYIDSPKVHAKLACAPRPRLVYQCWIDKGPGFSENVRFHYGPSTCGKFVGLWVSSDWYEMRLAVAWTGNKALPETPWVALLRAYWDAEKSNNKWEEPNYSEIEVTPRSLMKPAQIKEIARSVWPDWKG